MAKLEELIDQISESRLRSEIAVEVKKLKEQKKFGLVFEEHLPETVRLPNHPIRPGELVALKNERGKDLWLVKSVNSRSAHCIRPQVKYPAAERDFPLKELVVVKRFGEPIYPVLVPVNRVARGGPDKPWHTLINADNFHALQLLLYCYEGQVDVMFIDPPYNTGARDWKYNNDYVDGADTWRHSKWLSMMKRRLLLAKRLLKPDGVLIITIDEHEVHNLGVLLSDIMPEAYRQMVTIVINPKGVTQGRFSRVEEHAFYCFRGKSAVFGVGDDLLTPEAEEEGDDGRPRWKGLLRSGTNARREDRKWMFYPVLIDEERGAVVGAGDPLPIGQHPNLREKINGLTAAWPIRSDISEGNWGVGPQTLRHLISKGYVGLGAYDPKRKTYGISYLSRKPQQQIAAGLLEVVNFDSARNVVDVRYKSDAERQIKSVWHRTTHDAGAYGADLLKDILGKARSFPFPKSLYAVRDALASVCLRRPDALILDFFTGSGTTYHATCLLNAEDKGRRRCIMVTNNEVQDEVAKKLEKEGRYPGDPEYEKHGISEAVTWPRCKYATNGKRDDGTELPGTYLNGQDLKSGLKENLEYFRLDFVDPSEVAMGTAFEAILPMLWMKSGCRGECESSRGSRPWFMPKNSPYAVLIREKHFAEFRKELAGRCAVHHVFLVTDSEENFRAMSRALGAKYEIVQLYKSYLENFRINTTMLTSL